MNNDSKKKSYFRFGVLIFLWLLLIGSLSYAYFSVVFDNDDKTSTEVVTGLLSVDFTTGEYINNNDMWPINDSEIFSNSDKSVFSVKRSSTNTTDNVYYNIYLDDIVITDNYKSEYIKWKLYDSASPNSSSVAISEGNFENIGSNTSIQLNRERISLPKNVTHNYTLYIWISNSTTDNQTQLLEGSIEGKVKVIAVTE